MGYEGTTVPHSLLGGSWVLCAPGQDPAEGPTCPSLETKVPPGYRSPGMTLTKGEARGRQRGLLAMQGQISTPLGSSPSPRNRAPGASPLCAKALGMEVGMVGSVVVYGAVGRRRVWALRSASSQALAVWGTCRSQPRARHRAQSATKPDTSALPELAR